MLLFQDILGQVFLLLSFLIGLSMAAAPLEKFTNPPLSDSVLTYTRGSIIQITWETHLKRIALTLWHVDGNDLEYLRKSLLYEILYIRCRHIKLSNQFLPADSINVTSTGSYPWSVGSVITANSSPTVTSEAGISDKVF